MLTSFKGFHLCIKQVIVWCPDNQHRKKLNLEKTQTATGGK